MTAAARPRPAGILQALRWRLDLVLFKVHMALAEYHAAAAERIKATSPPFVWARAEWERQNFANCEH
jgi:hypothetical protein